MPTTRVQLRTALRRHHGNLSATARALGLSYGQLQRLIEQCALDGEVRSLRRAAQAAKRETVRSLLQGSGGNVSTAARTLGRAASSLDSWIARHGLAGELR